MRIGYFLVLPVAATAMNFLFVSFLVGARKVNAQPPGHAENLRLGFRPTEPEPYLTLQQEAKSRGDLITDDPSCQEHNLDEKDPMLVPMAIDKPPFVVDVYKRADISSFYGEEPGSRVETKPAFNGQAGKFINISPHRLTLFWYVAFIMLHMEALL